MLVTTDAAKRYRILHGGTMSKSYSTKALPSGTVLREWRLEEVLGVGGFGIVYKGRGIYFDELVAIKEYFPSAISERNDGDTVVPIDSDAEEVHALGLKKFVEEAKLLWNLSTPTRHPNIVSVRSLFEIHGTAYMVMDFEDGLSLSKLLREGRRFNEASLRALIVPIAEGLDRAHRVGVLHRDIKPPNILVNDDGRPVLIDFGSARFESGDATSTKVTFHTPPYAAIEQYVRTYAQGPWTDVYALGVVLYECVTGEKPPEVLERMHGGLGKPLAEGTWPGYSHTFLEAIDAAMTIRPDERPQSIPQWLKLFDEAAAAGARIPAADDDDRTQFATMITLPDEIVPVAPAAPGFETAGKVETPVPEDPSEVEFKRAGHDTNATRAEELMASLPPVESAAATEPPATEPPKDEPPAAEAPPAGPLNEEPVKQELAKAEPPAAAKPADKPKDSAPAVAPGRSRKAPLIAGVAAVLALAAGGGWYWIQNRGPQIDPELQNQQVAPQEAGSIFDSIVGVAPSDAPSDLPVEPTGSDPLAQSVRSLAASGQRSGAPASAVAGLNAAASRLAGLYTGIDQLTGDPLAARNAEIAGAAKSAASGFRRRAGTRSRSAGAAAWARSAQARHSGCASGPRASARLGLGGRGGGAARRGDRGRAARCVGLRRTRRQHSRGLSWRCRT